MEFVVIVMRAAEHGALILCSRSLPHDSTYFVWEDFLQLLSTQAAGLQLLPGLLSGLTLHQSFGLGQEVGQQDLQPCQTHTHTHTFRYSAVCDVLKMSAWCQCVGHQHADILINAFQIQTPFLTSFLHVFV